MPNHNTFDMKPVRDLLSRYLSSTSGDSELVIVDPFARNSSLATYRNDLDPDTKAENHMEAREFLQALIDQDVQADIVLLDPPYSPRQISECYKGIGLTASNIDTQTARLYSECKNLMTTFLKPNGIAITFGWNSNGFGKNRGFHMIEILLIQHGGAHNDTIVTVERKIPS